MICVLPQDTCSPKQLIKIIKNTRMFHCISIEEPAVVSQICAGRVTREASDSVAWLGKIGEF
jgi:hypothetical protein